MRGDVTDGVGDSAWSYLVGSVGGVCRVCQVC